MNIQFTGSGGHSCTQHANYMLPQNLRCLWYCAVIKLHILEWPFIVASLRHTCAIIMLSNQHLDMPIMIHKHYFTFNKCQRRLERYLSTFKW